MGHYHNKLDKKYFHRSVYVKKWEDTFNMNIKDKPLQYDIVFDTYNTIIEVNNILFATTEVQKHIKVEKLLKTLNNYLITYKNKINKSYDGNCINGYNYLESIFDELSEMKDIHDNTPKGKIYSYNLISIEKEIAENIFLLEGLHFDNLTDSKVMPYEKKANDKLPKKVNLKIIDDLDLKTSTLFNDEKQKDLNNAFISDYLKKTGIDLSKEKEQRYFIFDTLNRIKDLNNAIVDYQIYKDKAVLNILNYCLSNDYFKQDISFVKDITYINVFNKLKAISQAISDDSIDIALTQLKDLIEQFKDLYERNS